MTFGRGPDCIVHFREHSISRLHACAECTGDKFVLTDAGSTNGTFVNGQRIDTVTVLDNGDHVRLGPDIGLRFSTVNAEKERSLMLAAERNECDPLTGAFGRTSLEHALDAEISKVGSTGAPLSVLMIDVDRFNEIKDSCGQLAGDEVLAGMARVMRTTLRNTDVLARYGGQAFLVLAPGTPLEDAYWVADRIRSELLVTPFVWDLHSFHVTVSIGIASLACCGSHADRLSLLCLAEQRTWLAKRTLDAVVSRGGTITAFMPSTHGDSTLVIPG